jgi:hypothetical protein
MGLRAPEYKGNVLFIRLPVQTANGAAVPHDWERTSAKIIGEAAKSFKFQFRHLADICVRRLGGLLLTLSTRRHPKADIAFR